VRGRGMSFKSMCVGFVLTGSRCTVVKMISQLDQLAKRGVEVFPIVSPAIKNTDTKFGRADDIIKKLKKITEKNSIANITEAELIEPKHLVDVIVVALCTGNTMAKLANGIMDSTALMAIKAHLRNLRPVVIALLTRMMGWY